MLNLLYTMSVKGVAVVIVRTDGERNGMCGKRSVVGNKLHLQCESADVCCFISRSIAILSSGIDTDHCHTRLRIVILIVDRI